MFETAIFPFYYKKSVKFPVANETNKQIPTKYLYLKDCEV